MGLDFQCLEIRLERLMLREAALTHAEVLAELIAIRDHPATIYVTRQRAREWMTRLVLPPS